MFVHRMEKRMHLQQIVLVLLCHASLDLAKSYVEKHAKEEVVVVVEDLLTLMNDDGDFDDVQDPGDEFSVA